MESPHGPKKWLQREVGTSHADARTSAHLMLVRSLGAALLMLSLSGMMVGANSNIMQCTIV